MLLWRFLPAAALLVGLTLIDLHGPGGQLIGINPEEVTSVREPMAKDHFARGVRCLVYLSNGNFITVTETCITVRKKLIAAQP